MTNYQNGKMYQIYSQNSDKVYIGSTCSLLRKRLQLHEGNYRAYKKGNANYITAFDVMKEGDYDIALIEHWPCESKQKLEEREGYWVKKYKQTDNCINKFIPGRTRKQYRQDNAEIIKSKRKQKEKEKNKNKSFSILLEIEIE